MFRFLWTFLVFYKKKSSRQLFIRTNFNYDSSLSDSTNQRAAVNEDKEREKNDSSEKFSTFYHKSSCLRHFWRS